MPTNIPVTDNQIAIALPQTLLGHFVWGGEACSNPHEPDMNAGCSLRRNAWLGEDAALAVPGAGESSPRLDSPMGPGLRDGDPHAQVSLAGLSCRDSRWSN